MSSELTINTSGKVNSGPAEVPLEAQFFEHPAPEKLLPFVEAAVRAAGCGSVEVNLSNNKKGLLLMLPRPLLTTLRSSLRTMMNDQGPVFQRPILYEPAIKLSDQQGQGGTAEALLTMIGRLRLCPPDMTIQGPIPTQNGFFLMVSGPENRKDHYVSKVKVDLDKLVKGK